jgi:hypothetical protein
MLIECTVTRDAPVIVPIGNEKYHFEDDGEGRKVAEVWIESHIQAFLACSSLYREVKDEAVGEPAPTSVPSAMGRSQVMSALKALRIAFTVTEKTDALRAKLAAYTVPVKS